MAALESCPKHNLIAYLEKTDGNAEFHAIIDFLTRSSIHYALTVSPVGSNTFVEQFWTSAKSKTINNVRYITAKVAGKPVTISEASIRSDLLFDDADGIDILSNQAIFDTIQLMGSKSTSWDQIPTNIATPGKAFSGNVTYLFTSMLGQPTEDEGEVSARPSESQPIPSPPHPSADQPKAQTNPSPRPSPFIPISDSIPEGSGGNHGGQSSSDISLSGNEDGLTLQSVYDLCVSLCKQSVSMKKRLARRKSLKKKLMQKESVSKQGRKTAKAEPFMHKDPAFDDLDDILDNAMDYMETEDAHDEGRTSSRRVSTKDQVSTAQPKVSIDKVDEGTAEPNLPKVSTDKPKVSTEKDDEGTAERKDGNSEQSSTSTTVFKDDETIAQFLVTMSQNKAKQKEFEIKGTKDTDRPSTTTERSVLTLKPLPKINPKDKGKKVLEGEEAESDAESAGVNEAKRKFAQLERDAEVARKLNEEMQADVERERISANKASKIVLAEELDEFQAQINADAILVARMQEEEREKYTDEQKIKFLHDTIAA
ncbi:hypothetical protein Tco_0283086 [Tanacetum coccineum]